jgi:Raf kinase inhibitor-like YbhB/YbcL family protein
VPQSAPLTPWEHRQSIAGDANLWRAVRGSCFAAPVKRLSLLSCVVLAIGCGGGDSSETPDGPGSDGPASDGPADTAPAVFTLTSPAFVQDGAIPEEISCNGADTSPQLDWVGAPVGTLSFAIVFTDLTINPDFIHSVIYDIPANLTGLPADVDNDFAPADVPGAHQTRNFRGGNNFGYAGPCPGNAHEYEFRLYALDVAILPGATMSTDRATAKTLIEEHDLESTALSGTYDPNL